MSECEEEEEHEPGPEDECVPVCKEKNVIFVIAVLMCGALCDAVWLHSDLVNGLV